jgi:hypothetical protein
MSTWKRWSWRYRLGALFALALLLQGSYCPLFGQTGYNFNDPSFTVPGVGEVFLLKDRNTGEYVLKVIDPATRRFVRIGPGDPRFPAIDAVFRAMHVPQNPSDRAGLPGGSGTAPLPPVQ